MKNKLYKYIKSLIAITLIGSLALPSYATVGASDGSAFVTKAEFDAALSDFNARLTTFEAGINSKIDSQVSSYLDRNGIWQGKEQQFLLDSTKNAIISRVLLAPSKQDAIGRFFNGYNDTYLLYWLYKYAFTSSQYGKVHFRPVKLADNITKTGLYFYRQQIKSYDSSEREGCTIAFPYLCWEDGTNAYSMVGLAKPSISLAWCLSTESADATKDTVTYNEVYRTTPITLTWSTLSANGISRAPGGGGTQTVSNIHAEATVQALEHEEESGTIPTTDDDRALFNDKLGTTWNVQKYDNMPSLIMNVSYAEYWSQFFSKKGETLWGYWEIQWGNPSMRAFQVWQSSAELAVVLGMSTAQYPGLIPYGCVY